MDTARSVESLVRSYFAALTAHDPDAVVALVTDDFVNEHTSALGTGCVGRDEYRSRLPGFFAGMPDLAYEVERVIVDGASAAAPYRLTATSDGHDIDIRGVMVIELRDDAIAKRTDYWDALTFLRQAGQA